MVLRKHIWEQYINKFWQITSQIIHKEIQCVYNDIHSSLYSLFCKLISTSWNHFHENYLVFKSFSILAEINSLAKVFAAHAQLTIKFGRNDLTKLIRCISSHMRKIIEINQWWKFLMILVWLHALDLLLFLSSRYTLITY